MEKGIGGFLWEFHQDRVTRQAVTAERGREFSPDWTAGKRRRRRGGRFLGVDADGAFLQSCPYLVPVGVCRIVRAAVRPRAHLEVNFA
jgi:hypothetical protein